MTLDPSFTYQNSLYTNVGFGLTWFSSRFMMGISSPYLYSKLQRSRSSSEKKFKSYYLLQSAYIIGVSKSLEWKPSSLIKYLPGAPLQIDVSSNILIKEIVGLGITWRSFDSVDIISQILVSPNIEVGYPYDFITSEPAKANNGSHEIMLTYRLPVKGRSFPRCSF